MTENIIVEFISACSLLEKGVVAIFGPSDKVAADHVQSVCDSVDMPNLVARWDRDPIRLGALNFHPHGPAIPMVG